MVSAFELFMGFSKYYNSLSIEFEESTQTNTTRIISYADQLGRMLGYHVYSELSFRKLFEAIGKECAFDFRRKKPDVCWAYRAEDGQLKYELVLESEQQMDEDKITEEIRKLLIFPSELKVLYCAHDSSEKVVELVRKEADRLVRTQGPLLLIVDPWISRKTFAADTLKGILLDSSLEMTHEGTAKILELKEAYSRKRLLYDPSWKPVDQKE